MPVVTGPIPAVGSPGTDLTRNYPQQTAEPTYNLSARGYVEEEFFFQGTATQYETPALADGIVLSTGHPYKTRMVVRRPRDPNKFNGVVLVEWANVTPGYNFDIQWGISRDYLTREGYAYVSVAAQRVGVQVPPNGLTEWSTTRYSSLDVTDNGAITDDSLSYDIFSQAGRAIRTNPSVLSGLRPQLMIAIGAPPSRRAGLRRITIRSSRCITSTTGFSRTSAAVRSAPTSRRSCFASTRSARSSGARRRSGNLTRTPFTPGRLPARRTSTTGS
jgi:hypothetical protein